MIVIETDIAERYFAKRAGLRGIKAARAQYAAWRTIVEKSEWKMPEDVKKAHPKASILKSGRVVFNIKANDYRLIALIQYRNGVVMIRFSDRMRSTIGSMRRPCDENDADCHSE